MDPVGPGNVRHRPIAKGGEPEPAGHERPDARRTRFRGQPAFRTGDPKPDPQADPDRREDRGRRRAAAGTEAWDRWRSRRTAFILMESGMGGSGRTGPQNRLGEVPQMCVNSGAYPPRGALESVKKVRKSLIFEDSPVWHPSCNLVRQLKSSSTYLHPCEEAQLFASPSEGGPPESQSCGPPRLFRRPFFTLQH